MNTYITLLKGINVGGHKKVPMAELRESLTKSGFQNVQTYIQSGNVMLQSKIGDISTIEIGIEKTIKDDFGFEVSVLVKTRKELQCIFDNSPFEEEKKKILEKHKEATKTHYVKVNETKKGLQKPEEKKVIKKTP